MRLLIWRVSCCQEEYNECYVENCTQLHDLGLSSLVAQPAPRNLPRISVVFDRGAVADFFSGSSFHFVSQRLRDIIESFDVAIEFLQCEVRHVEQIPVTQQYYLFNMLEVIECFDFERSEYEMSPHGVDSIEKLVLKEEVATGHHLFWIGAKPSPEFNPKAVRIPLRIVSSELATAIIRSGCTGVRFVLPENFCDYPPENVAWTHEASS